MDTTTDVKHTATSATHKTTTDHKTETKVKEATKTDHSATHTPLVSAHAVSAVSAASTPSASALPSSHSGSPVAGAVIGSLVGVAAIGALAFFIIRRKRRVRQEPSFKTPYDYGNAPYTLEGGLYQNDKGIPLSITSYSSSGIDNYSPKLPPKSPAKAASSPLAQPTDWPTIDQLPYTQTTYYQHPEPIIGNAPTPRQVAIEQYAGHAGQQGIVDGHSVDDLYAGIEDVPDENDTVGLLQSTADAANATKEEIDAPQVQHVVLTHLDNTQQTMVNHPTQRDTLYGLGETYYYDVEEPLPRNSLS